MRVIKPIEITDSILFSSSVPEPDTSVGEVEWGVKSSLITLSDECDDICSNDTHIFSLNSNTGVVTKSDLAGVFVADFTAPTGSISVSCSNTHVNVMVDGDPSGDDVFRYDTSFVYLTQFNMIGYTEGDRLISIPGEIWTHNLTSGKISRYWVPVANVLSQNWTFTIETSGISAAGYDGQYLCLVENGESTVKKYTKNGVYTGINYNLSPPVSFASGLTYTGADSFACLGTFDLYTYVDEVSTGNYDIGEEVIKTSTHKLYRSLVANQDDPEVGVLKDIPTWQDVSPTNRYRAFDERISTVTTEDAELEYEFLPGEVIDSIVGINVKGATTITVTMTDPTFGEIYNKSIEMTDNTNIVDWFAYLWNDFETITSFALLDLPAYASATTKINIQGASISAGAIIIGRSITLGVANYGSSIQLIDNSRIEFDEFGEDTVIKRPSAKLVNYDVAVDKGRLNYVYRQLDDLTGIATVWIGTDEVQDETLVYGYHIDNNIGIDTPTLCKVTIQVRGLI